MTTAHDLQLRLSQIPHTLTLQEKTLAGYHARLEALREKKELLLKAQVLLDKAISRVSEGGIKRIEEIITEGLRVTFPDQDLKFVIQTVSGARGNSYKLLVQNGDVVGPLRGSFGGAIINVTQLLLRVVLIQRFNLQRLLVLDEALNNVSDEYMDAVSSLLRSLCEDQGFKIFLITHKKPLCKAAHRVYRGVRGAAEEGPRLVQIDPLEVEDED